MAINYFLFVVFAVFIVQNNAQDALDVTFKNPGDRYVELGAEVVMEYEVNRSPLFGLANHVYLWRNSMKDGKLVQEQLADTAKQGEASSPEFYEVKRVSGTENLMLQFKILSVRDVDDATFQVQVVDKTAKTETNATLNIIVLRDNDKLQMKFGDNDFFSESMDTPFEVDAGKYSVTCRSEGSNPATEDLHVIWKEKEVQTSAVQSEKMASPLHKFSSMVMAEVEIELADSEKYVECRARSKLGNQLITKAPIKVNVYDPEVECTDGESFVGKRYMVLSCVVTEAGHEIQSYAYEHGKTGEVIFVDDQNAKFDEVKKEDLGNSKVRVDLKLHSVKDSHFSDYYLIITQKNGHVTRRPVSLSEVPAEENQEDSGPKDCSSATSATLVTLILCAVGAIWKTL